jgi:hypothetical protein
VAEEFVLETEEKARRRPIKGMTFIGRENTTSKGEN